MSSARVVRCWVKSRNERNPYGQLLRKRTQAGLPLTKRRKAGTTSNHHAPYVSGYTRTTMAQTKGSNAARRSKPHKRRPSSDCRLQLACTKSELLVIADQHRCGCIPQDALRQISLLLPGQLLSCAIQVSHRFPITASGYRSLSQGFQSEFPVMHDHKCG